MTERPIENEIDAAAKAVEICRWGALRFRNRPTCCVGVQMSEPNRQRLAAAWKIPSRMGCPHMCKASSKRCLRTNWQRVIGYKKYTRDEKALRGHRNGHRFVGTFGLEDQGRQEHNDLSSLPRRRDLADPDPDRPAMGRDRWLRNSSGRAALGSNYRPRRIKA